MDLISVIIPTLDRAHLIGRQLEALAKQDIDRPFELIVADNGSSDGTAEVVRSFADRFERLRLVDAGHRDGSPGARNEGVEHASGTRLAFCDSDDVAEPDWLRLIIEALEAHERCIVAGRIVYAIEGQPVPTPDEWGPFAPREAMLGYLAFADSASMAIRADDLRELGGFDEQFRRCADAELSLRAQTSGVELVEAPDSVMVKYRPEAIGDRWRQRYHWATYHPLIYRRYRNQGMPARSIGSALGVWVKLTGRAMLSFRPEQRRVLVQISARHLGHLVGSIRWRVLYL